MVLVSLLVVTFGIYNATNLSLTERSLEIGLLHVIGFTLNKLRRFLLARALVLTLTAYSLGWLISLVFINHQQLHASVDLIFLALRLTPLSSLIGLGLASHLCLSWCLACFQASNCAKSADRERLSMSIFLVILRLGLHDLFSHRRLVLIMSISIAIATAMVCIPGSLSRRSGSRV